MKSLEFKGIKGRNNPLTIKGTTYLSIAIFAITVVFVSL